MYIVTYHIIFSGVFITQLQLIIDMIIMSLLHVHVVNLAKTSTFFSFVASGVTWLKGQVLSAVSRMAWRCCATGI